MTPSWVSLLADDGLVSVKELAEWLGIGTQTVRNKVRNGLLPKPYACSKHSHGHSSHKWKVRDIRQWLKTKVVVVNGPPEMLPRVGNGDINTFDRTIKCAACKKIVHNVCHATRYCPECADASIKAVRAKVIARHKEAHKNDIRRKKTPSGPLRRRYEI